MGTLFIDGFDKYGPANSSTNVSGLLSAGEWTTAAGVTLVAGLSSTGQALTFGSSASIAKTLATSYSRLIGGFRFQGTLGAVVTLCQFRDGASNQCTLTLETTNTINLRNGSVSGTILTGATSGISANTTHYLEWDITFSNSGPYTIYLDGVQLFTGTGDTTTTANNTASAITISASTTLTIDDFYLFDTTGSAPNNAVLLTSPRIETQFPNGDSSVQFGFGAAILGSAAQRVAATNAPGANKLFLRTFTPTQNATINSVSCIPNATSAGANFKAVIYSDSSGAPNTLLSSGTQVTGTTSGTTLTGALVTPQSLTAGTAYWIGFITDTSVTLQEVDASAVGQSATNTYGSGAPGTAPAMTTGQASWVIYGNLTGVSVNYYETGNATDQNQPVGDPSYVFDSTVGHEDLYNFPALSVTPATIYSVAVKGYAKRSDSGARTVSLRAKSNGSDGGGSATGQTPATSYGWLDSLFDTDPHTSAAWTPSNLNAATSGFKIDS